MVAKVAVLVVLTLTSVSVAQTRSGTADVSTANLENMENWIARLIAFGVGLIGAAFLAVYPFTQTGIARERADIDRAAAPLLSVPLELLQVAGGHTVDLTIPTDKQWKKIVERLGSPTFLLAVASARGETRPQKFPSQISDSRLVCR